MAVLFLLASATRLAAPFGDSDEGINGAVWGYDARALREQGPLASRLGGWRLDGTKYATHPPLIVVETAAIESVLGEHPWSTRAPAWLGALGTIPLMYLLLRELRVAAGVSAAATAAALGCHFFLVYGSMLDTMVVALPFAVATTTAWLRDWRGGPRFPWWAVALLALLTGLASWQGIVLVGFAGLALAARARTGWRRGVRNALPYLVAAGSAALLTVGWGYWVYGSLAVLHDKLLRRTGGEEASVADMVSFQLPWLGQLLGLGVLATGAAIVSLRDRRFRAVAALWLATVAAYAVVFGEGAGGHQYWNYWALVPAAIGFAFAFDRLAARLPLAHGAGTALLAVVAAAIVAVNLVQPDDAGELIDRGARTYDAVSAAPLAPDQTAIPYVGEPFRADDWLRYRGGPPGDPLQSREELLATASAHPDWTVVVLGACAAPDVTGICEQVLDRTGGPGDARVTRAADLAVIADPRTGFG